MTEYVWVPDEQAVAAANSTRFARAHGMAGYAELVRRSIDEPEWFWDAVVDFLGLEFSVPYTRVLDDSDGPEWARWFVGGELNLTWNCVDRHALSERAGHDAIRWEGEDGTVRVLSFADLSRQTSRCAAGLRRLGVGHGTRVALAMPMIPEAIVAAYAVAKLGAILVPMFSGFGVPAMAARLRDSGAECAITAETMLRRGRRMALAVTVADACAEAPEVRHLVCVGEPPAATTCDCVRWDDLGAAEPALLPCEFVGSEHPLMISYTSGTTGQPKGAVHVHGGFLVKTAQEVYFQTDLHPGDALFWLSDMGWIMAPWAYVGAHATGHTLVLYDGAPDFPAPDRLWSLAERHRITFLGMSPTLVRALRRHGTELATRHDLSSVRLFGSAGEPWDEGPYRWLAEDVGGRRRPIINLSGGTEVGSSFLSCDIAAPIKACSLGAPALGMAVDVYDDDRRPLRGARGELVCRRPWPSMTRGIWGSPQRYLDAYWSRWPGTWVHGDWASVDADGAWFLHGRSDDTLNVAGKRISSAEYEAPLLRHEAVADACVVGVPDELKGESARCYVVLETGTEPSEALRAELLAAIEAAVGRAFRPGRLAFVTALPRTRSGKVVRRTVRAIAVDDDPGDISTLADASALDALREPC